MRLIGLKFARDGLPILDQSGASCGSYVATLSDSSVRRIKYTHAWMARKKLFDFFEILISKQIGHERDRPKFYLGEHTVADSH
jgi:hypothetical protein